MNEGRERPFVSVKFTPVGRTLHVSPAGPRLSMPNFAAEGVACQRLCSLPATRSSVTTAEGPAVGTVMRAIPSHRGPQAAGRRVARPRRPESDARGHRRPAEAPAARAGSAAHLPDEDP